MCGIAGLLGFDDCGQVMERMLCDMLHRGPDGGGIWKDDKARMWLGHRRLSIIDLDTGAQPQASPDGGYVIVFNGEIYNYIELRPELEAMGWRFRTTSDTEVLLAGLILQGAGFLSKTVGMFAFALWDSRENSLMIARDRIGVKPLYYAEPGPGKLVFASELKSVLRADGVGREINPAALDAYLSLRYVPSPLTMVKGVFKFPAGHVGVYKNGQLSITRFWEINFDSSDKPGFDEEQAVERFSSLLEDSVRLRMRSDVPFGAFLSGGVDSASIVGLMSRASNQPVLTYSIGFEDGPSELDEAERVARFFGSKHTAFTLAPEDLRRLPDVAWSMDEPFADPIVLAMYLLSIKARESVKVILTGEGADELLSGYVHHPHLRLLARLAGKIPASAWKTAGAMAEYIPMPIVDRLFNYPVSPGEKGRRRLSELARAATDRVGRYLAYVSIFSTEDKNRLYTPELKRKTAAADFIRQKTLAGMKADSGEPLDEILNLEYYSWLQDNILFKQDKTLMAHGIEGRVPFCDHRLVEFASKLPLKMRQGARNKEILRRAVAKLLPPAASGGRKKAFMVPLEGRYGATMKEIIGDTLTGRRMKERGLFNSFAVEELLKEFRDSPFLVGKQLSSLLMLELWMERVLEAKP